MTAGLEHLVVEGLGPIRRVELDLTTDITVLIGANGSGKSNLVSALELVARIWDDSFQDYLYRRGGISNILFEDSRGRAEHILIELLPGFGEDDRRSGYGVVLAPDLLGDSDRARIQERHLFQPGRDRNDIHRSIFRHGLRSSVRQIANSEEACGYVENLIPVLEGCRVFHFDDVSGDAPTKGWSTVGDDLALRSNAENIAAYLLRVREEHSLQYQRIVAAIRAATPFFDDFVLEPSSNERIRLRWRQRGLDRTFLAREASDGMLRFICLATLLLGPDRPATIILDEPELGLHPMAIHLLAEMARTAGRSGHRVILATQSVPLVSHFELGEIVVVDRIDGATAVHRPDEDLLKAFLDDYSTGTLWEMNLLGGRPSYAEAAL